ncbi:hypothetical protein [Agrobacterium vitis]|uniref:hypothetical protein n=1 Tax=Agrobacterium vitis TaxID=373 RepID=UPI001571B91A|nr:hypothetical protein [Agrobacterium vitis]NSZ17165.1 hypothetical protein [Agrobacterium vitis]QZO02894.1 hypothetical protein K4831_10490 [Agrobacterium vitis]UJL88019.1 hypothetical protein AVF2S5_08830 [Agrobacterium vitis]
MGARLIKTHSIKEATVCWQQITLGAATSSAKPFGQQNMTRGLYFLAEAEQNSTACKRRLRILKAAADRACGNNVDSLP